MVMLIIIQLDCLETKLKTRIDLLMRGFHIRGKHKIEK